MPTILANTNLTISINSIPVLDEQCGEHLGRGGSSAFRNIRVAWSNRISLAAYLLGVSGAAPQSYPDLTFLYCQEVDNEGEGVMSVGPNGMVAYERCLMKCQFRPLEYQGSGTNAVEAGNDTIDYGVEMIPLPTDKPVLRFGASGTNYVTAYANPPIKVGVESITRTRYNLTSIPASTYEGLLDKTNNATYLGRAAETLRFDGVSTARSFDTAGAARYAVTYHLSFRSVGWNKILNPATGTFDAVTFINGGAKPYPTASFSGLGIT
jgi:hypothetical protein